MDEPPILADPNQARGMAARPCDRDATYPLSRWRPGQAHRSGAPVRPRCRSEDADTPGSRSAHALPPC
jgi:hypothetical protein